MIKRTLRLFIVSFLLILTNASFAQVSWEKLFSRKSTDVFRCVIEVPSGGYALAGYTADSTVNDTDAYVVRMDVNGDTMWTRRFNGQGNGKDLFYKIINTSDGGFAMCGYTTSVPSLTDDMMYMKIDGNGNMLWYKTVGGNQRERAEDIVETSDGGYTLVGSYGSPPSQYYDAYILHTNSTGDSLWSRLYGTSGYDAANTVRQLTDGGYIMAGKSTNGANGLDFYLIRTSVSGDSIWSRKWGTTGTENIECVRLTADGGFIMCGSTNGAGTNSDDGYLAKTDSGGVIQWTRTFGGTNPDDFHRVENTTDGGFVCSGTTSSSGPLNPNMWLFKTNSTGDSLWSRTFGGVNHDHGYSAQQTSDGGYIFTGYTSSFGFNSEDALVVKTDSLGMTTNLLTYTSIFALISPVNNSCGTTNVPIRVIVRNYGLDTVPNIPVTIQITGAITQTLNQTYPGPVYPGDADTMLLNTTLNTTAGGNYTFVSFTGNNNDVYPQNNGTSTTIHVIPYSSVPTVTNGYHCGPGSVLLLASSPDSVYWFSASTGGTLLGAGSSFDTPSISSPTIYYAQAGLACPSSRVAVTASVRSVPANPISTSGTRCGPGTVNLNATAADPVFWYNASSGGTQVGSGANFTTPSITTTTVYYAEAFDGFCGSGRVSATATVNSLAADPVTSSASRCGNGSVVLGATAADPVSWYAASSGGTALGTGNAFTTPAISSTTTYYAEAFNGNCPSHRIAATATITPVTPDPSVSSSARCGPGTLILGATSPYTLIWYATPSGGSQLGFGSTFTTPFLSTTVIYYVQATNGICPGNYLPVNAIVNTPPAVHLGPDTIYVVNTTTLDAGPGFSLYQWTPSSSAQSIQVNSTGTYCVTVTDGNNCTGSDCIYVNVSDGTTELNAFVSPTVFPNPSNGQITIESASTLPVMRYTVYNASGGEVYDEQVTGLAAGDRHRLSLGFLPAGLYLLRMESKDRVISQKIQLR